MLAKPFSEWAILNGCPMNCFVVYGNYGDLIVNRSNGVVLRYEPARDSETGTEYGHILRFDIDEYAAAYPGEQLGYVDNCDIGFWTKAGQYEPPLPEFRADVAARAAEHVLRRTACFVGERLSVQNSRTTQ